MNRIIYQTLFELSASTDGNCVLFQREQETLDGREAARGTLAIASDKGRDMFCPIRGLRMRSVGERMYCANAYDQ